MDCSLAFQSMFPSATGAAQLEPRATPWDCIAKRIKALKGRPNGCRNRELGLERPFRAFWNGVAFPRALPWARVGSPLRGLQRQRRAPILAQGNALGLHRKTNP